MRRSLVAVIAVVMFGIAWARSARSSTHEGASAAAPTSCVAEQFALRAYVKAVDSGDVTGPRDPARISAALTPLCREAIDNGRWPGLAHELLARVTEKPSLKKVVCELAPPEALSAIVQWESADEEARSGYDVACAVALFRHRREEFARLVAPRLMGSASGCAVPPLASKLAPALTPEERLALLPVLEEATRRHSEGRDRLFALLCQHQAARAQAVCQAPREAERAWARQARVERARPAIGVHVGLAALFALAAWLLWHRRGQTWLALGMSVLGSVVLGGTVTWIVASSPSPGAGALGGLNVVLAAVLTPVGGLAAGAIAWLIVRAVRTAALPWCLAHAVLYAVVTALHAWSRAWDRLC